MSNTQGNAPSYSPLLLPGRPVPTFLLLANIGTASHTTYRYSIFIPDQRFHWSYLIPKIPMFLTIPLLTKDLIVFFAFHRVSTVLFHGWRQLSPNLQPDYDQTKLFPNGKNLGHIIGEVPKFCHITPDSYLSPHQKPSTFVFPQEGGRNMSPWDRMPKTGWRTQLRCQQAQNSKVAFFMKRLSSIQNFQTAETHVEAPKMSFQS